MLKSSSVSIAKNRLRALVVSDRVQCTPSVYDHICRDLYRSEERRVGKERRCRWSRDE